VQSTREVFCFHFWQQACQQVVQGLEFHGRKRREGLREHLIDHGTTLAQERLPGWREAMAANFQALGVYGREQGMHDPKLRRRLGRVRIPALVVWGESDGVVDPDYGRAYAQSLPNARFELIPEAGHLPQIEQPERLLTLVWEFADSITAPSPVAGASEKR
jgi:pimeloyl-ACP methyl ester carboxylesterase